MSKSFKVQRCLRLPSNAQGRDLVVGDLHGHRSLLERALPLALHVEGCTPFNVMHGDLHPIGSRQDDLFAVRSICVREADAAAPSRANFARALESDLRTTVLDHRRFAHWLNGVANARKQVAAVWPTRWTVCEQP